MTVRSGTKGSTVLVLSTCAAAVLAGCVSTRTIVVTDTPSWHGRSIALSARSRPAFMAMTAGKAMLGTEGVNGMVEAGQTLVADNTIPDPARELGRQLLAWTQSHYGVIAAPAVSVPIQSTAAAQIAGAAPGVDLLLDVQSETIGFRFRRTDPTHYVVYSSFRLRVVDVPRAQLLAEGFCRRTSKDDPDAPTYDELLADHGARLKTVLDGQRDACLGQFKTDVLGAREARN